MLCKNSFKTYKYSWNMMKFSPLFLVFGLVVIKCTALEKNSDGEDTQDQNNVVVYRAGVVDFIPTEDQTLKPMDRMFENVRRMKKFTKEAKEKQVDILVFPEYSILSSPPINRTDADRFGQYVPNPKYQIVPCLLPADDMTKVLRALSCMARDAGIYVLVNLSELVLCKNPYDKNCDANGNKDYNTNVVFDRNGMVVSKWRKFHLWHEQNWYNYGNLPNEEAMFTTDFGVTFTHHICFDQFFDKPSIANVNKYGVKDVIMATAWIEKWPLGIAHAWQYGWSRGEGVNVLAAGLRKFCKGNCGTGIYNGLTDIKNFAYAYNNNTAEGTLVVADVNTTKSKMATPSNSLKLGYKRPQKTPLNSTILTKENIIFELAMNNHKIRRMDFSNYSTVNLPPQTVIEATVCDSAEDNTEVCCQISWDNPNGHTYYRLMAFSGEEYISDYGLFSQVCAVVHCPTGHIDSCTDIYPTTHDSVVSFNLTGHFKTPHVNPSMVSQDLRLISEHHWKYDVYKSNYDMTTVAYIRATLIKNLMFAQMWARWYEKDPYCEDHPC